MPYGLAYTAIFYWNPEKTSSSLNLDEDFRVCQCSKGNGFKSALGSEHFTEGGRYYFEIFLNKGHMFKIGVCRPDSLFEEAFCDRKNGWGIYNAQLRHNSISSGPAYGHKLKAGDTIGVALDMTDGILTFYHNGECWGEAFKDPELATGELVAAVACINKSDTFSLRWAVKED